MIDYRPINKWVREDITEDSVIYISYSLRTKYTYTLYLIGAFIAKYTLHISRLGELRIHNISICPKSLLPLTQHNIDKILDNLDKDLIVMAT